MAHERRVDLIGVAYDWGTTGITIIIGAYTLRYDQHDDLVGIDTQESQYNAVSIARSEDDASILETVWCIRRNPASPEDTEVLLGADARKASKAENGPVLLRYPKFLLLDAARIKEITGGDNRKMGAKVIKSEREKSFAELAKFGYTGADLVAHVVKDLWDKHVRRHLASRFFTSHASKYAPNTQFIYVTITRPSIWQLDDDYKLLDAFRKGLTHDPRIADIRLADEAHSAVTGILFDHAVSNELKVDQVFGVADAGGGTCDIVTHVVRQKEPLRLEEAAPATGAFVGGDILVAQLENELDEDWKRYHIPGRHPWRKVLDELVTDFKKEVKLYAGPHVYDPPQKDDESGIQIGSSASNWKALSNDETDDLYEKGYFLKNETIHIVHWKAKKLFEPFIGKIASLINKQIQDTKARQRTKVSHFFLVGGFFRNSYLQERCLSKLKQSTIDTTFHCPDSYPRSTVPRGALRSLADRNVDSTRTLQVSIGFKQDVLWDSMPGRRKHMKIEEEEGHRVARDLVGWVFTKGDKISGPTTRIMRGKRWLQPLDATCNVTEPMFTSPVRRKHAEIWLYEPGKEFTNYVVLADKKNRVREQFHLESDSLDPRELPMFKVNPKLHLRAAHVKTWYQIEATWDGDVFTYELVIPKAGHFDCSDPADPDLPCPGAQDPKLCPGRGQTKRMKCTETLAEAFGVSGTVERLDDANPNSDSDDRSVVTLSDSDEDDDFVARSAKSAGALGARKPQRMARKNTLKR